MTILRFASRSCAFALIALTALACSPYDGDLLGGSGATSGSGGTTGGMSGVGGTSGGGGVGGACVPTVPPTEVCDTLDNDCNGTVNDGPAADSCRATVIHATSTCLLSGQCLFARCDTGWYDCDGNRGTGCETAEADAPCGRCGRVCVDGGDVDSGGMMSEAGVDAALADAAVDAGVDAAMTGDACVPTSPTTEVCDGVDNNCDGMVDPGTTCPAMCTGVTLPDGKVYAVCLTPQSWGSARTACRVGSLGMDLVIINDAAENTAVDTLVNDLVGATGTSWLGANDNTTEGTWVWRDNSQFWMGAAGGSAVGGLYANWASGQPDDAGGMEDCAVMTATGQWDDLPCGSGAVNPYVCEK